MNNLRPENYYGRITGQAELVTMETEMMEDENVSFTCLSLVAKIDIILKNKNWFSAFLITR